MSEHHVLIVEDDAEIRDALAEILAEEGYRVTAAADGRQALEVLRRAGPALPCLIVLDLMMPVMSGRQFREEQLQDRALADVPVLLFSGTPSVREDAAALRVTDYLAKPVDVNALLQLVERYCRPLP